jgi:hypothetical protein
MGMPFPAAATEAAKTGRFELVAQLEDFHGCDGPPKVRP